MGILKKSSHCDKTCPVCQTVFHCITAYDVNSKRYCSKKCGAAINGNGRPVISEQRPCAHCGKSLRIRPCDRHKKYCSYSCSSKVRNTGEANPAWKGSATWWKRQARERDAHTCQFAGCDRSAKNKTMHAHHMIPRAAGGADELNNLITLCEKHHCEVERQFLAKVLETLPAQSATILRAIYRSVQFKTCPLPPDP